MTCLPRMEGLTKRSAPSARTIFSPRPPGPPRLLAPRVAVAPGQVRRPVADGGTRPAPLQAQGERVGSGGVEHRVADQLRDDEYEILRNLTGAGVRLLCQEPCCGLTGLMGRGSVREDRQMQRGRTSAGSDGGAHDDSSRRRAPMIVPLRPEASRCPARRRDRGLGCQVFADRAAVESRLLRDLGQAHRPGLEQPAKSSKLHPLLRVQDHGEPPSATPNRPAAAAQQQPSARQELGTFIRTWLGTFTCTPTTACLRVRPKCRCQPKAEEGRCRVKSAPLLCSSLNTLDLHQHWDAPKGPTTLWH